MEQLIKAFGIDGQLIIVQIINFVLLAALLSYFLYKPVLKILADREEKIKQGIADAEMAAAARSQAEDEKKVVLTTAHKAAEEVANRAAASAKVSASEILAAAEENANDILKDAAVKAEQLRTRIKKETESEIAQTAILAAEKILREKTI
jgi:F-type H+-transporting ATPase subunit b